MINYVIKELEVCFKVVQRDSYRKENEKIEILELEMGTFNNLEEAMSYVKHLRHK